MSDKTGREYKAAQQFLDVLYSVKAETGLEREWLWSILFQSGLVTPERLRELMWAATCEWDV